MSKIQTPDANMFLVIFRSKFTIGFTDISDEGTLSWEDGTPVTWHQLNGNSNKPNKDCIIISPSNWKWTWKSCGSLKTNVICQYKIVTGKLFSVAYKHARLNISGSQAFTYLYDVKCQLPLLSNVQIYLSNYSIVNSHPIHTNIFKRYTLSN